MRVYEYNEQDGSHSASVANFDNVNEWAAHCKAHAGKEDIRSSSWAGLGITAACKQVTEGVSEQETKMARELIDKIDAHFSDRHKYKRVHSYVGARVHVGKFMSGSPKCVVRRKRMHDDFAPVKLVIEIQVSAGVGEWALAKRGAAVAALTQVMSKERPVELYIAAIIGDGGHRAACSLIKVNTRPLSIAQMVALAATEAAARRMSFIDCKLRMGKEWNGQWGFGNNPNEAKRVARVRNAFKLKPQDIFIPGGHLDSQDQIMRDPVAWVNDQLETQRSSV